MRKDSIIIITGAYGLVGSALFTHLKEVGYVNVFRLGRKECNLLNLNETLKFFEKIKPEYLFHCAARVYGIMGNMNNKGISFYENITINTNVIESSRIVNVKKITVMGSGAVYPFPSPGLPLKEDMIFLGWPHKSEDSYANAKRAMLAMLYAYEESYKIDWAYVVSCNLFGPNDKFDIENGHVIPSLISKFHYAKKNNSEVVIWGDGSSKRDFMYVKDAASALLKIMQNSHGPINLGSGNIYSILEMVNFIKEVTSFNSNVIWDVAMPNGQDYRAYDLTKLKESGFECKYEIKTGLIETWNWFRKKYG
jgi:GDP-L-fucose synthase